MMCGDCDSYKEDCECTTCGDCGMWAEDCECHPEIRPAYKPPVPNTHCPQCGMPVGEPHNPWCPEAPYVKEEDPFQ